MEEMQRHGRMVPAPMRAGMDRKTARKYGSCALRLSTDRESTVVRRP
jgi:hypothetical protein